MKYDLIPKCREIVVEIEQEKGMKFLFAAMIEPEGNANKLDLILSADWIEEDQRPFFEYISQKINAKFTPRDWQYFGSVMVLDPNKGFVPWIRSIIGPIERDYVMQSKLYFSPGDLEVLFAHIFVTQSAAFPQLAYAH